MNGFAVVQSWVEEVLRNDELISLGAAFLGWILLWSGTAKLRKPLLAAAALVDFGFGRRPKRSYGTALGACEVAVALLLLIVPGVLPLIVAAVILSGFAVALGSVLRSGGRVPCLCFGNTHSVVSLTSLARTGALALLAWVLAAAAYLRSSVASAALLAIAALGLLGVVVFAAHLPELRRNGRLLLDTLELSRGGEAA